MFQQSLTTPSTQLPLSPSHCKREQVGAALEGAVTAKIGKAKSEIRIKKTKKTKIIFFRQVPHWTILNLY
jgi:hypothetical protein